jgi:hypothetical protein
MWGLHFTAVDKRKSRTPAQGGSKEDSSTYMMFKLQEQNEQLATALNKWKPRAQILPLLTLPLP